MCTPSPQKKQGGGEPKVQTKSFSRSYNNMPKFHCSFHQDKMHNTTGDSHKGCFCRSQQWQYTDWLITDFLCPVNHKCHRGKHKLSNHKWRSDSLFILHVPLCRKKIKLDETGRQKLERQNSWQKGESLTALDSQQKRLWGQLRYNPDWSCIRLRSDWAHAAALI